MRNKEIQNWMKYKSKRISNMKLGQLGPLGPLEINFDQKEINPDYPTAKEKELIPLLRELDEPYIDPHREDYLMGTLNNLLVLKPELDDTILDYYLSKLESLM